MSSPEEKRRKALAMAQRPEGVTVHEFCQAIRTRAIGAMKALLNALVRAELLTLTAEERDGAQVFRAAADVEVPEGGGRSRRKISRKAKKGRPSRKRPGKIGGRSLKKAPPPKAGAASSKASQAADELRRAAENRGDLEAAAELLEAIARFLRRIGEG